MSDSANHGSVQVIVIRKKKAGGEARRQAEIYKKEETGGKVNAGDTKPYD